MYKKDKFKWINYKLKNFIFNFSNDKNLFKYRNQIRICSLSEKKIFKIFLKDLNIFEKDLYLYILHEPINCLNFFEFIINQLIQNYMTIDMQKKKATKKIQVIFISDEKPFMLKQLSLAEINKLVTVKIIVLSIGLRRLKIGNFKIQSKFKILKNFNLMENEKIKKQNSKEINFKKNKIMIGKKDLSQNDFVDYQIIKAQDFFEKKKKVPRCIYLNLERQFVGKLYPGKILIVTGVYLENSFVIESKKNNVNKKKIDKKMTIHVIGIQNTNIRSENLIKIQKKILFDENFLIYAQSKNIYNWIISSIAPNIHGYNEIKIGIACLLFGTTETKIFDNLFFNRQINLLIIGNFWNFWASLFRFVKKISPLSFVEKFSASFFSNFEKIFAQSFLEKKTTEEFKKKKIERQIILSIKEMDKILNSKLKDFLEVLENGTSCFLKKNFTPVFKKKISILAGMNQISFCKIFKNYKEKDFFNMNLLLNFDLIFWNDIEINHLKNMDQKFTKHVMKLFEKKTKISENYFEWKKISFEMLKKYIYHISNKFYPTLNTSASEIIKNAYLHMRNFFKKKNDNLTKFPNLISIRHLETMIKIASSLSKMKMAEIITPDEALESVRLFQKRFFLEK